MLRGDPAHKIVNPLLYRIEEVRACWREVSAPVLWVDAAESDTLKRLGLSEAQHAERRRRSSRPEARDACKTQATCCITTSRRKWRG